MDTLKEFQALHKGLKFSNQVHVMNPVLRSVLDTMEGCDNPATAAIYIEILVNICAAVRLSPSNVTRYGSKMIAEER